MRALTSTPQHADVPATILLGTDILSQTGTFLERTCGGLKRQIALITVPHLADLYGETVTASLASRHGSVSLITVPDSESSKSWETAATLYDRLIAEGFDRKDCIVALGGGMIGDLAGFIAATYLRGLDFINIPTTLLAQTDSAMGGKVAINHRRGKNLIGTFFDARLVVSDIATLDSLPDRAFLSGLGEVVKYALILDPSFFDFLEEHLHAIKTRDHELLESLVHTCCQHKLAVVSQDRLDHGYRGILNFGHTVGHGLEMASGGTMLHGEAVAMGMIAACWLSKTYCSLPQEAFERFSGLLTSLELPLPPMSLSMNTILEFMFQDKKRTGTQLAFILLNECGSTQTCCDVEDGHLRESLEKISAYFPNLSLEP